MAASNNVSASQALVPVTLLALTLFVSLGFQATQVLRDRDAMHEFIGQQDKPLEESRKVQAQVTALALGTKKLADGGDKNAQNIIAKLQQLGITVGEPPATGAASAPTTAPTMMAPPAPTTPPQP